MIRDNFDKYLDKQKRPALGLFCCFVAERPIILQVSGNKIVKSGLRDNKAYNIRSGKETRDGSLSPSDGSLAPSDGNWLLPLRCEETKNRPLSPFAVSRSSWKLSCRFLFPINPPQNPLCTD